MHDFDFDGNVYEKVKKACFNCIEVLQWTLLHILWAFSFIHNHQPSRIKSIHNILFLTFRDLRIQGQIIVWSGRKRMMETIAYMMFVMMCYKDPCNVNKHSLKFKKQFLTILKL